MGTMLWNEFLGVAMSSDFCESGPRKTLSDFFANPDVQEVIQFRVKTSEGQKGVEEVKAEMATEMGYKYIPRKNDEVEPL